jgi:hypothetical protein
MLYTIIFRRRLSYDANYNGTVINRDVHQGSVLIELSKSGANLAQFFRWSCPLIAREKGTYIISARFFSSLPKIQLERIVLHAQRNGLQGAVEIREDVRHFVQIIARN